MQYVWETVEDREWVAVDFATAGVVGVDYEYRDYWRIEADFVQRQPVH